MPGLLRFLFGAAAIVVGLQALAGTKVTTASRGYTITGCMVLVTDMGRARTYAAEAGATMPLLDANFLEDKPGQWDAWIGELAKRLWGNCDVWGPNLAANGMQTFQIYRDALQAAINAAKLAPAFAAAELERIREKAKALGLDPSGWGTVEW